MRHKKRRVVLTAASSFTAEIAENAEPFYLFLRALRTLR